MREDRRGSRRGLWRFVATVALVLLPIVGVVSAASPAAALSGTTTSISSTQNPSGYSEQVVFDANVLPTVGGGTPTGTVTFFDGTNALATVALDRIGPGYGHAAIAIHSLVAGSHSITAHYNGDSMFTHSTSSALTEVIYTQATTTVLLSVRNPVVAGQNPPAVFVVIVSPNRGVSPPSGSVEIFAGAHSLGTFPLDPTGQAATLFHPSAGHYSITSVYTPDSANWLTSSSPPFIEDVLAPTATALASSANPSQLGQGVTYTATVTVNPPATGVPTGTVGFTDNGAPIAGCGANTVTTGAAQCSVTYGAFGTHPITATYSGDTNLATSTSSVLNQTVPCTSLLILTAGLPGAVHGQPYSAALSGCGGVAPYKWAKIGKLPKGLKLNHATGVISGTTGKATGTFMFTVRLTDKTKPKGMTTKVFSITVS